MLADTHVHLLNIYIKYMLIGTRVRKYVGETAIAWQNKLFSITSAGSYDNRFCFTWRWFSARDVKIAVAVKRENDNHDNSEDDFICRWLTTFLDFFHTDP